MYGKAANCHILLGMVREIKVSIDWFGCVLVISFYVAKVLLQCPAHVNSRFPLDKVTEN